MMNGMELRWKHSPSSTFHELWLLDDEGESLPGSYTWLRDLTAEPKWKRCSPKVSGYITFKWGGCFGHADGGIHTEGDGFTLEQVKREAEEWLLNHYIKEHLLAVAKAKILEPISEWAKEYLSKDTP